MSEDASTYDAIAFHPSFGNEPVAGRLRLTQFTLRFAAPDIDVIFPASQTTLRISEEQEGEENQRLYFTHSKQPSWTLATDDFKILNHRLFALNTHLRRQVETIFGQRASHKAFIITVAVLVGFVLLGLSASWVVNGIIRSLVAEIPASLEKSVGDSQCEKIKTMVEVTEDPRLIARLQAIYAQLRLGLPDTNLEVQFHIIESPIPNAGSIPGHVFVNRGLFGFLNNSDEMAGVLAHELGHIEKKHVFRRMISRDAPAYILKAMFHNSRGAMASLAKTSTFVMGQTFSREYEREADAEGWKYLVAANIDPHGFIDALEKLHQFEFRHAHGAILSDHPPTEDRIAKLEAKWEKLPRKTGFVELPEY